MQSLLEETLLRYLTVVIDIGIFEGWGTGSEEIIPLDTSSEERPRANILFLLYYGRM